MDRLSRRQFGAAGGALAITAATGASAEPAGGAALASQVRMPAEERARYVHPELREVQARMQQNPPARPPGATPPPLLAAPSVRELTIPGPKGAPDIHAFMINASPDGAPRPVALHMHGGGMVSGDARRGVPNLQQRCLELDCAALTIDYRLAPATRYPGQVDDAYAALTWLHANAASLNLDPARIAVIGESAGGGLAAMLAIRARDRGEVAVLFQALMYPMLDDRYGVTRPLPPHVDAGASSSWPAFLGVPAGSERVAYGLPGRLDDVRGLPPAWIGAGSIDPLAFASLDYARKLMEAGVLVELTIVPGAYHAFNAFDSSLARQFNAAYYGAIGRAFKWGA